MSRTVLVTGASSGIGAAVAVAAAAQGASVAALDVDAPGLDSVAERASQAGAADVLAIETDVRSEDAVAHAFARCRERLGVPVAVLANAGIEINGAPHELPLSEWSKTVETNLTGAFLTARHAIRELVGARLSGSIVCTSSPSAFVGFAGGQNAAYAASKGGVSAMVRSLALDYAGAGIRVNGVVPGAIDTPLLTAASLPEQRRDLRRSIVEMARNQIPAGRVGTPDEVANAVLWLWSDAASYVTGSHLTVDGGLLAKGANSF